MAFFDKLKLWWKNLKFTCYKNCINKNGIKDRRYNSIEF